MLMIRPYSRVTIVLQCYNDRRTKSILHHIHVMASIFTSETEPQNDNDQSFGRIIFKEHHSQTKRVKAGNDKIIFDDIFRIVVKFDFATGGST